VFRHRIPFVRALALAASAFYILSPARPQAAIRSSQRIAPRPYVQAGETSVVTLEGNVHPLARPSFDDGVANADLRLEQMLLVLAPSPRQKAALDALVEAQQNPTSPQYRQWLSPAEFGAQFGADPQNLARVAAWLTAHGFTIDEVPAGRGLIQFSGTTAQVFDAFHTEIHRYRVDGAVHLANSEDPQIPQALASTVLGIVSLHDFRRTAELKMRPAADSRPEYSAGNTHYLFPADFAAIYDLNPVYNAANSGAGVSIAIAGRSDIQPGDVATFQTISGLPANAPTITVAGADPGMVANDQQESTLDVEWSGAVAPRANVNLVVARSTATTDGIDLAAAYIVNHRTAPVLSVSYASCERDMGVAELAFYNQLWEQAASEGISVFVASGDAGAAGCSAGADVTGKSAAVNGMCSSPYATCVGGTEFNDGANPGQYWSAQNSSQFGSALGYIPEAVWNESAANGGAGLWASGGGASTVYAQPAWQASVSGASAANGMRAVPDVALASADHDGTLAVVNASSWIMSGTSVAAPEFAGLMALVVEKQQGTAQGSANPKLYSLVSANQNPFHATPSGNNTVPGVNGFIASGAAFNLATGLGSVDGALLVNGWSGNSAPLRINPQPIRCARSGLLPGGCRPTPRTPIIPRAINPAR